MEFEKYQHLERFGTVETSGIEMGMCYVFPKIDGTNSSLWWNDRELQAGSRKRHLTLEDDNAGFYEWAIEQKKFHRFFTKYHVRLYGEWLVPHTLKTYEESAWRNFYVFDVMIGEDSYMPYDEYKPMLEEFAIEYIPPICKVKNPTYERLINQLEKNGYLIEDGKGTGEGIVIKNYDYQNKYGRTTWAKIVKNEFKSKHQKVDTCEIKESKLVEEEIVKKYVTLSLVEKEKAKIELEDGWRSKDIPRLLNTVYYCLVTEECWNFVKEFRNPTIDFKRLSMFTTHKIKELMPEIFN